MKKGYPQAFTRLCHIHKFYHKPVLKPSVILHMCRPPLRGHSQGRAEKTLQKDIVEPIDPSPWFSNLANKKGGQI